MKDANEIAKKIARELFEVGDEPDSPTQRLQFMGGDYVNRNEKAQGGLCEVAMAEFLEKRLRRLGVCE